MFSTFTQMLTFVYLFRNSLLKAIYNIFYKHKLCIIAWNVLVHIVTKYIQVIFIGNNYTIKNITGIYRLHFRHSPKFYGSLKKYT